RYSPQPSMETHQPPSSRRMNMPTHRASQIQQDKVQARIEEALLDEVVASFDKTDDARLKFIMQRLVVHLHSFVRDVRLTEEEWETAIDFLTQVGHITDDKRQEFVLLSDTLGVSMQTIAVNNQAYKDATEATVFGPFFVDDAPEIPIG